MLLQFLVHIQTSLPNTNPPFWESNSVMTLELSSFRYLAHFYFGIQKYYFCIRGIPTHAQSILYAKIRH